MRFVLATGNRHKAKEFGAILAPCRVDVDAGRRRAAARGRRVVRRERAGQGRGAGAGGRRPTPRCSRSSAWPPDDDVLFLADDSGLEVEALGWAPGVTSARYAGVDGPGADVANYTRLLRELAGFAGPVARRARFVCSVVAVAPDMTHYAATGHWWGAIAEAPRGEGGFGYDPVFVPEGSDLSVAEWPQEAKDQASHRALAGRALVDVLRREGLLHGSEGVQIG